MIKLVYCLRRLPQLSREEFQKYWLESHGPLVRRHADALAIRRYVQAHTVDHGMNPALRESRGGGEPYDGVAQLWWESADALAKAVSTPEGQEAGRILLEDEKRFIDLERSALWLAEEHTVIEDDA